MATARPFVFEQLSGERKTLTLEGWAAPMGRPRQGAVVRDAIEIRVSETYYPGSDDGPTRHIFGDKYSPWDLHGRFRDRAGGVGFAKSKTDEVKDFVRDKQPVRVSWGDIVSVNGFIVKFDPGRESEAEVEWTMTVNIDGDNFKKKKRNVQVDNDPKFTLDLLELDLKAAALELPKTPNTTLFDMLSQFDDLLELPANFAAPVLDSLDTLVSIGTSVAGSLRKASASLDAVEKATFADLNRLNAISGQVRQAWFNIRAVYTSMRSDAALLSERAEENAKLWRSQTTVEEAVRDMLAQAARVQRRVQLQLRGRQRTSYVANPGDTWESISSTVYGSPDRADDIRQANGIPPGQYPQSGVEYIIPA